MVATILVACGHTATPTGSTTRGAPSDDPVRCEPQGNVIAQGASKDDVPVVALFERNAWLSGFDVPSLLVWADGTVVYSDGPYKSVRLLQSTIPVDQVEALSRGVVRRLHDAPAYAEIINATDLPSCQIIFRDDNTWRVVDVYGLTRDVAEREVPESLGQVVAAYHELLDRRPSRGAPAPTNYPRPPRWPESLPTYRGQTTIDQLALCAYRRRLGAPE